MTLILASRVLDLGLSVLDTECDAITTCSARPTSYADATTAGGHCLAIAALTRGTVFAAPVSDTNGRKTVAVATKSANAIANGTATYWVAVDTTTQRVLASDIVASSFSVTIGQKVSLASFAVSLDNLGIVGVLSTTEAADAASFHTSASLSGILAAVESPDNLLINFNPWWGDDGSANAPSGTPQYATALQTPVNYPYRPPWKVAGVDYAVGINPNKLPLKTPGVDPTPAGCQLNGGGFLITGNNAVIDGWNFSGGSILCNSGIGNSTITNCRFTNGNAIFFPAGTGSGINIFRYNYCDFSSSGQTDRPGYSFFGTGSVVLEYNIFYQSYISPVACSGNPMNDMTIRFNVWDNCGIGAPAGWHTEAIHTYGSDINHGIVDFNTVIQNNNNGWRMGTAIWATGDTGQRYNVSLSHSYNTFATSSPKTGCPDGILVNLPWDNCVVQTRYNYWDLRAIWLEAMHNNNDGSGGYSGSINFYQNVNMRTGGIVQMTDNGQSIP